MSICAPGLQVLLPSPLYSGERGARGPQLRREVVLATAPPLPPSRSRSRRRRWLPLAALLALLGVLVVSHGCHGEHVDDELSAAQTPRAGGRSR